MTEEPGRTFSSGIPDPYRFGLSMRYANGSDPDPRQIKLAAELLGREAFYVDKKGYECEIIGAAVHADCKRIVYVESRAKELERMNVDVAIKIHYLDKNGKDREVDIESYNPFFGCDIRLIEWYDDDIALLVYREKHRVYVYRIGDVWKPPFAEIDDTWQIKGDVLSFIGYKPSQVQRLSIPSLKPLPSISLAEAEALGQLPKDDLEDDEDKPGR